MELYYGIIFMKRSRGCLGRHWSPLGSRGSPGHAPGTPGDVPGTPGHAPGTPGHAPGTLGHAPGTPRDVPETPQGLPWDPRGSPGNPMGPHMGPLMDHKNGRISTNRQRQKLSFAVLEAARHGPSHGALDRADFSIKRPPKSKKHTPRHRDIAPVGGTSALAPMFPVIYTYIYIYTHIYI